MKTMLALLLALVTLSWALVVAASGGSTGGTLPWVVRQEALYLSGLLSMALMSLAMFLSTRPAWLETPLGGMDRVYRTHKWAGILGVGLAIAHWAVEEVAADVLKATVGRDGRVPKETHTGLTAVLHDLAQDMGEWAFYAVLFMLAITLWRRFPYKAWRLTHLVMPIIYLMLAVHAVFLAPTGYWREPVGWLLGALMACGTYGALHSLIGRIGRRRQARGTVVRVERAAPDVLTVQCQLDDVWQGHRPGQFAFVTFDPREGAHPFTIACAEHADRTVTFQIKALGDYTAALHHRLAVGQQLMVEGPYGRFDLTRQDAKAHQVWIAGGIGVTPFLAWLDALHQRQSPINAELHYCTRDRTSDPFVATLAASCAALPGIRLHIHASNQGEKLKPSDLAALKTNAGRSEIWFCGPQGLADALQQELGQLKDVRYRFHQEAFEMR